MKVIADYHMHTPLCGHACGEPFEYADQAVKVGLKEIGFSDHAPLVNKVDPSVTMDMAQLPEYYQMMEKVKDEYSSELTIKIGIEADFIPGYEDKTRAIIADYNYDYVIGSVHFIKDWGFDNPTELDQWDKQENDRVYQDYYDLLRQSAKSGLFDIMGHVDLVKKFGHRPATDFSDEIEHTASIFKECDVVMEINTSGLRKQVKEIYPTLEALKIYCRAGVPITFGSDAHDPADVGSDFEMAMQYAKDAGYGEYVLFKNRSIEKIVKM